MTRSSLVVACRGLAATAFAAGLVALASGCSTGLITQTDKTVPAVPGVNLQTPVPGGQLAIRNAVVAYPGPGGYPAGGTAPLALRIVNEGPRAIRLTGAASPDGRVVVARPQSNAATASPSPAPSPSPSPSSPSTSVRPSGSASAPPSPAGPSPSSRSTPSPSPSAASISVEIPPGGLVILDQNAPQRLQLVGLTRPIKPGESVTLTLTFSDGVTLADISVPVDVPSSPASRIPAAPDPESDED